jgi:hypothetical protein
MRWEAPRVIHREHLTQFVHQDFAPLPSFVAAGI